ncbi:MAG: hypothetical protein GX456_04700, partial [Verrucomicrobia bacterium]|nr:hypothetical protein [Verrucomicrobiota bacterium]
GAGKNARAPARAGKGNGVGSAAVPGRINLTTDRTPASITQIRRPNVHGLGAGKPLSFSHVRIYLGRCPSPEISPPDKIKTPKASLR